MIVPIVTLPDESLLTDVEIPENVEARVWDWETPPSAFGNDITRVQMVIQPLTGWPKSANLLGELPALKVVQTMSAGVNSIQPLVPPGVSLHRLARVHHIGTSEVTLALLLASLRKIDKAVLDFEKRLWDPYDALALADQRVLIIGAGDIGNAIRTRIEAFEASVTRVARTSRDDAHGHVHGLDELDALLPIHDVVIMIVPLDASTYHLANDAFFTKMKNGSLFMNVARGAVADTDALVKHLRAGRIRAALEVLDPEPIPAAHAIWDCPNVVMTPHVGGMVPTVRARAISVLGSQIAAFAQGRPLDYQVQP